MRISDQNLNRLNVLKAIRRWGPVSRTELPTLTGLSGGTITQLTADLLKRQIILEKKGDSEKAGRPRAFLSINGEGAIVVGASIEGDNVLDASFVDLGGRQCHSSRTRYDHPATIEELAEGIATALSEAIAQSPFSVEQISRVGVAIPGIVDSRNGIVHYVTSLAPEPAPLAQIVSAHVGLPVTIENDGSSRARAEHWFGEAMDLESFTLVHVGYAIGSAEYWGGLPKLGANGLNSELGHVKTDFNADARLCVCGGRGCLQMYGSMFGLLQKADMLADAPFPPVESIDARFEQFLDRAEAGDPQARGLIAEAVLHIGVALANHINASDPGHLLVSILNARFLALVEQPLREVLAERTIPAVLASTNVRIFVAASDWRYTGTAALALEQLYLDQQRDQPR